MMQQNQHIKIDRSTLPKDDQRVTFQLLSDESWHEGTFSEGDDLFVVSSAKWYNSFEVICWHPVPESKVLLDTLKMWLLDGIAVSRVATELVELMTEHWDLPEGEVQSKIEDYIYTLWFKDADKDIAAARAKIDQVALLKSAIKTLINVYSDKWTEADKRYYNNLIK